jgi:hypothetical protein
MDEYNIGIPDLVEINVPTKGYVIIGRSRERLAS